MIRTIKIIAPVCLSFALTGCYCFNKTVPDVSSIRRLSTSKPSPLCDSWGGSCEGRRSFLLNAYYGFPIMNSMKTDYISKYVDPTATDYTLSTKGLFGVRMEKYIGTFITPYAVLGLGIDYSQAFINIQYTDLNATYTNQYDLINHRTLLSINYMTLVNRNTIGYLTFQGGISQIKRKFSSDNTNLPNSKVLEPAKFDYRIGYGFQYYPVGPWGIAIEGGYGGGAYVKVGLFFWVF